MNGNQAVIGIFSYLDSTIESINKLKSSGFSKLRVFSPVPNHEIEEAIDAPESIVRFFTLGGAILGIIVGLGFTIFTTLDYPIQVSAKPIISLPPFMVILFECMVLIGALSTLLGLLINSRIRKNASPQIYDTRFSEDKFGVVVTCTKENMKQVEEILRSQGAEEIKFEGA